MARNTGPCWERQKKQKTKECETTVWSSIFFFYVVVFLVVLFICRHVHRCLFLFMMKFRACSGGWRKKTPPNNARIAGEAVGNWVHRCYLRIGQVKLKVTVGSSVFAWAAPPGPYIDIIRYILCYSLTSMIHRTFKPCFCFVFFLHFSIILYPDL